TGRAFGFQALGTLGQEDLVTGFHRLVRLTPLDQVRVVLEDRVHLLVGRNLLTVQHPPATAGCGGEDAVFPRLGKRHGLNEHFTRPGPMAVLTVPFDACDPVLLARLISIITAAYPSL